jgi:4-aminobutyrate aminotransferase
MEAPRIVVEPPGPKAREILERDSKFIMQSFTRWYPLVVKRSYGSIVEDVDGNLYIDFNAGIAVLNVGHRHPKVVEAIKRQLEKFLHYSLTDFYYEEAVEAAEILDRITPVRSPAKTFFTNSGAESVEGSIKVARGYFKGSRPYIVSFTGAFHGRTYGAMSLSASKTVHRRWFSPLLPGVVHAVYPDPYRCPFPGLEGEECGEAALGFLEDVVFSRIVDPVEVAAIIFEPIQGEGGYVVPPDNFLPGLEKVARRHGILLIADEVQTGFARTGRMFAVEHWGVEPDVMALAKAMGGGLPLGAIVGRSEVMSLPPGSHANTFGGNPVALAAFKAVIDVIQSERLAERAARLGGEAMSRLRELADSVEIVGTVRGKGLMIGVEIVKNKETKEPNPKAASKIIELSFKRGLLVIGAGVSAVRIAPPLTIEEELFFKGIEILEEVVRRVAREEGK